MIEIIKYKAIDGTEFNDKEKCVLHENLINEVDLLMNKLVDRPKENYFYNGEGYIQQSSYIVARVKMQLLDLMNERVDHHWIKRTMENLDADPSWVQRIIGESEFTPLAKAWYRFSKIDKDGKEWGQPYFVKNNEDAKMIELASYDGTK